MNDKLKEMLIKHEGYKLAKYSDSRGIATIGVGHNVVANPLPTAMAEYLRDNGEITDSMVEELFESDVGHALDGCHTLYPDYDNFTENRQNALCDFIFNVGIGTAKAFKHTNICINTGDWDGAADGILQSQYAKQVHHRAIEVAQLLREG